MAAGLEYQLICKIIEQQDFHAIQKLKVDETFFFSPECRQMFQYLHGHFHAKATFGHIPSWHIVHSIYPAFPWSPTTDDASTMIDQLRLAKMRMELLGAADTLGQIAESDPRSALDFVRSLSATMTSEHEVNDDLTLGGSYEQMLRDYHIVAEGKGLTGLPWPWEILNEETQGIHKGEFIVMYGRPKSMKTWTALYTAAYINKHANARVLVYSLEMAPPQIMRRVAALRVLVDYKKFKKGQLQPLEYQRVFQELANIRGEQDDPEGKHNTFMVCGTAGDGGGGVSFLHSKIREFQPDLVIVDGMYLMKDDRQKTKTVDWKAIAHISQDLKRTAQEFMVPIIGVTQANRKAEKNAKNADLAEIAYTDSLAQDCDLAMRVQKRINKDSKLPELIVALPGMREGDLDAFLINAVPATDFSFKSAIIGDNGEEDEEEGKKKSSRGSGGSSPPKVAARPAIDPKLHRKT